MVIREWRGRALAQDRDAYPNHFRNHVIGELRKLDGFLGADLVYRSLSEDIVEYTVLSRWASMDAVRAFAGDDPSRAVVEPDAVKALTDFDRTVSHHESVIHVSIASNLNG